MVLDESKVRPLLGHNRENSHEESNMWYLDNGASNHMSGQKSKFYTLDEGVTGQVKFGDGSAVEIKGKGSIVLKCKNGDERVLKEVYFIPSLRSNIISLGQLAEEGNRITIKGEYMWVHEEKGNLLMKVKRSAKRLYKLIIESGKPQCLLSKIEEVSKLWHARLGHVNYQAMSLMAKEKMVKGFSNITQPKYVCVGCLLSKQMRKQMPTKSTFSAAKVLELVHGDLCGPITPETTAGNRSGIRRHYTAPYTPQQNGVMERRNRTVMEMARSLLKEMNLPTTFWGEVIRHALYVLNRLPTRALTGITPYEAWTGQKPDIAHLRVFDCVGHMKVPSHFTSKLDDRSIVLSTLERSLTEICEDEQMTTFVIDDMLMNDGEYGEENQDAENETQPGSPLSPFTTQDLRAENYDDSVTPK
ncbi:hypothetical protein AgCh_014727 [Apium graveolens]